MATKTATILALVAAAVWVSVQALDAWAAPWAWIGGTWAVVAIIGSLAISATCGRVVLVNLAAVLVAIACYEGYLDWLQEPPLDQRYEGDYESSYFVGHGLLGYVPRYAKRTTVARYVNDELIYSVDYDIDAYGHRRTATSDNRNARSSVLFFGGSVTFGEGVDGDESMPYRVSEALGQTYEVHNFGFHGYGPHQMLAVLEFRLAESVAVTPVSHVIYQALPTHVERSAGRAPWDLSGPAYRITPEGLVEYEGGFDTRRGELLTLLLPKFEKSIAYQKIFGSRRARSTDEIELFTAIVRRSRELVEAKFPGAEFHVLLWRLGYESTFEAIRSQLENAGIAVHPIDGIFPGFDDDAVQYKIGPYELHPNRRAHELIADYVVDKIVTGGE